MKKKLFAYAAIPALALALTGAGIASAHGFTGSGLAQKDPAQFAQNQQDRFNQEASLLGISVDDVKAAWAKGETLQQLAQEHNITADQLKQKMRDQRQQQIKTSLQVLVDKGIITQAQADTRLQAIQTQMQNNQGKGFGRHMGWIMGL